MNRIEFSPEAYNLALDAAEATHKCDFHTRTLSRVPSRDFPNDLHLRFAEQFAEILSSGANPEMRYFISQDMQDNLTLGKPFPEEFVNDLKKDGLAYTPRAYRGFMNLFANMYFNGQLYREFASPTFLEFGIQSYNFLGLITSRELEHLPFTNFSLMSNLTLDFSGDKTFMHNKKFLTVAEDVQELPRALAGRPVVLLHGRFNGFFTLNYLEAILSTITSFDEMPCFVIGVDDDASSRVLKDQAPFMNQIFRAGLYTFLPYVEGVFLADRAASANFNAYWGEIYKDMNLDYLVLEENDPFFAVKTETLRRASNGQAKVLSRKSEFEGIPRLSGSDIKSGNPRITQSIEAQWRNLTINLFGKYFDAGSQQRTVVLDWGTHIEPIQTPLFLS